MARIVNNRIIGLEPNEVFVFGSNEAGVHGAGAAKQALQFGALLGKGMGLQGNTYAIPTKDEYLNSLPLPEISAYVDEFIRFAKQRTDLIFLVTAIGCGLAGYKHSDIAPLFQGAFEAPNVRLSDEFIEILLST